MVKYLKKDFSVAKKNKKKLDKYFKDNSREISGWLDQFVSLFNECGVKTKEGSVQLAFSGVVMLGMFKSMKFIDKKEKLRLLKDMKKEIGKQ